jgi:carbonic anhydrase/acetyltransferase-like protein (isoleucine patch superfamily)
VAVYRLGTLVPRIADDAYVHPDAVVIGDVTIGPESTVWPSAVLRGDYAPISVGARTSIQDAAVVHVSEHRPTIIGDDCVIGHLAYLEGCTIEPRCLISSGAVVLHLVSVGEGSTVAANAVVREGTRVPSGALALGVPAAVREGGSKPDAVERAVANYVANGRRYRTELERID